jgi:hypothetical protein
MSQVTKEKIEAPPDANAGAEFLQDAVLDVVTRGLETAMNQADEDARAGGEQDLFCLFWYYKKPD